MLSKLASAYLLEVARGGQPIGRYATRARLFRLRLIAADSADDRVLGHVVLTTKGWELVAALGYRG